jgi:hypothetical protein
MIWSVIWFWLLGIFTTADIITTKVALSLGFREYNPFMAPVIDFIVPIKIGVLLFMIWVVWSVERTHKGHGWIPVSGAACVTFAAVVWNVGKIGGMV